MGSGSHFSAFTLLLVYRFCAVSCFLSSVLRKNENKRMKSLLLCTINNVPSEIKEETIGLSLTVWVFFFSVCVGLLFILSIYSIY